jgi:glycolate oxidase
MSPPTARAALAADLRALVGTEHVHDDPATRLVYEADGLTLTRAQPDVVVLPTGTDQVAAIMRRIARDRLPVTARGAGSGLSGGCVAVEGGVVLSLARMRRILDIDVANRAAVVEPGVVNLHLSEAVRAHGLAFAPDPSSQQVSTIGGNVAENAGGPHCLKYGATSAHVLGLTVVLADGAVVRLGGKAADPVSFDFLSALVGSEGMFAVITEITVRLVPVAECVRTVLCAFETVEDAGAAVSRIIADGLLPAALEMLDQLTIRAVEEWLHLGLDTHAGAMLLIEVDGTPSSTEDAVTHVLDVCRRHGATGVRSAESADDRATLWKARKSAFGAYGRLSTGFYVMDGVVPRSAIPEALRRIAQAAERFDLRVANVFHAGDGNLHPCVLFDWDDADQRTRAVQIAHETLAVCVELGGALSGEHGVGVEKRELMPLAFTPDDLQVMRAVRRAFDPDERMNPGKVFPTGHGGLDPALARPAPGVWI